MTDAPSAYRIEHAVAELQRARERLLNDPNLAVDENALADLLGPETDDLREVLTRLLRSVIHVRLLSAAGKAQNKAAKARYERYDAREEALLTLAVSVAKILERDRVEPGDFLATLSNGKQSLVIEDEAKISDVYVMETITTRKFDKAMIAADIKAGRKVDGAKLVDGDPYWTIRVG